ncbi:Phthalate dioxygenase reductase [Raoultella terrigena]|uniref:Phthalate dioxygenase reductase n=1 Tax=Raoultella terrigena TaxID=577 RepID=A0A4U9D2Q8_RAOTE|nr:Phthalate dioxygenase reductase [Raoultella terrigena]
MEAEHSLLIGGGIGITPMLAMADTLFRAGKSFEIHYCGRSRESMAFLHELADCHFSAHVRLHISDEGKQGASRRGAGRAPSDGDTSTSAARKAL